MSGSLRGIAAESNELSVTLVPVDIDGKAPAALQLSHQAIYVALEK